MDPKILAAVFASIAALTMSGTGSMEDIQNLESQSFLQDFELPFELDNIVGDIREGPEPENKARIDVRFKSFETILEASGKSLIVKNYTHMNSTKRGFQSTQPVEFREFSGSIKLSNVTGITGESSGFHYQDLNYTQNMNLGLSTDTSEIRVREVERQKINLENVDIEFKSESGTGINAENAPLNVNSFTGNITVYPDKKKMVLLGFVDQVEAGTTSYGG